jgi:hypothetical protein
VGSADTKIVTSHSTTQKAEDKYPFLEWETNPRFQYPRAKADAIDHTAMEIVTSDISLFKTINDCVIRGHSLTKSTEPELF